MKSSLAESFRKDQLDAVRRMTPEERLKAFAEHCRRIGEIARLGEEQRRRQVARRA